MFWCKDTPVYIYGAGLKGKLIFDLLGQIGCNLCGFLDKTAQNGSMGQNVFHPAELSIEQRTDSIVICSVTNVFEHKNIAVSLAELGYVYILYKAVDNDWEGNKEIIDIIWNYIEDLEQHSLEEMKFIISQEEIAAYHGSNKDKAEAFSVKEKNGYIDVMVPTIFLYTFPKDLYVSFHRREDWLRIPYERNIHYYIYCADLFRLFEKGAESDNEWEEFVKVYKRYFSNADVYAQKDLDNKFEQHLAQRYHIYEEMNRLYHFNRSFFEENPIFVKWNENRNCLYVRDGNNRLAFLLSKGVHSVMCRMSKEDYNKWMKGAEPGKYIFSMLNKQTETRLALQWMGRRDLLREVKKILIVSDSLFLHDAFQKMGISVVVYERALANKEEYQTGMQILGDGQYEIVKEINYKENYDLIWLNLTCMPFSQKLLSPLTEQAGMLVCEGKKENVQELTNQVHGKLIETVCVYWAETEAMYVGLLGKENMHE